MDVSIPVTELVEGMYIVDLDRPWTDTPFMLQGFNFDRERHATTLNEYCKRVTVNLERSIDPGAKILLRRFGPKPPKPLTRWQRFGRWLRRFLGLRPNPAPAPVPARPAATFSPFMSVSAPAFAGAGYAAIDESAQGAPRSARGADGGWWLSLRDLFGGFRFGFTPRVEAVSERKALDAQAVIVITKDRPVPSTAVAGAQRTVRDARSAYEQVIQDIRRDRKLQLTVVQDIVTGLVDVAAEHPDALIWLNQLKGRDASTYEHAIDVSIYMVCLGRHLGYPRDQLQALGLAGLLQDVGYLQLPDDLLGHAGKLSDAQFAQIKEHVAFSRALLAGTEGLPPRVLDIIAQHHERYDGSGYPRGLIGTDIDPFAQIAGIADTFHSMTSARPYRKAVSTNQALQNLYKWKGGSFNDGLVEQFIQCIGIFSVGTLVELSTGEIGIVIAQNRIRRLKPRVMVLLDADRQPYPKPFLLELINDPVDATGASYTIRRDLPHGSLGIDPSEYFL